MGIEDLFLIAKNNRNSKFKDDIYNNLKSRVDKLNLPPEDRDIVISNIAKLLNY